MLDKIKQILQSKNIDGYKIIEQRIEANELFFIKKNVDMDRAKKVHHIKLTVYVDYEEELKLYKGSMETNIYPTMNTEEIHKAIDDAVFAAKFVKNPFYPLVNAYTMKNTLKESDFAKENLPYWMNELTKAVYQNDIFEKGGINSCEIFLNRIYTHIINSEGLDVEAIDYEGMIELITYWREEGEEVELYRCLHFSEFRPEELSNEVKEMIHIAREKAIAGNTPAIGLANVLLTREAVKEFFAFYYEKSNAATIYNEGSTWKIGNQVQGEAVQGDLITMKLDPFMENSTYSGVFDEDGFPLNPVTILEKGKLINYIANRKYAHYLNVEPSGSIKNMIIEGGKYTLEELKSEPYLEVAAFSDFTVDEVTGDFGGEMRLAWYFDGVKTIPVTGGSITGNINELQHQLYLSKELQKENYFEGPKAVKILNMSVAGIQS